MIDIVLTPSPTPIFQLFTVVISTRWIMVCRFQCALSALYCKLLQGESDRKWHNFAGRGRPESQYTFNYPIFFQLFTVVISTSDSDVLCLLYCKPLQFGADRKWLNFSGRGAREPIFIQQHSIFIAAQ